MRIITRKKKQDFIINLLEELKKIHIDTTDIEISKKDVSKFVNIVDSFEDLIISYITKILNVEMNELNIAIICDYLETNILTASDVYLLLTDKELTMEEYDELIDDDQ